jgi:hypothetical protein
MQTTTTNPSAENLTRALLTCGVIAAQHQCGLDPGFHRQGFEITRHDVSLLSNGNQGWIQITNFLVAGLLSSPVQLECIGHCIPVKARTGDRCLSVCMGWA